MKGYSKYLQVGFTDNELSILEQKADNMHMQIIDFVRYLIFGKNTEKEITKKVYEKLKQNEERLKNAKPDEFQNILKEMETYGWE